ncbi:MAG: hypothetical protein ABI775_05910 [Pseudonocardiales bacterium]
MTGRLSVPRPALVPALVRLAVVLAGLGTILVQPRLNTVPTMLMVLGVVLAAAAPARFGATVATVGFVLGWTTAYGWHTAPAIPRTLVAATALYTLHASASLAAFLPLDARVQALVVRRYAMRCIPVVAAAAVLIAVSYAVPRSAGPALVELAGLLGVLVVVGIPGWLLLRGRAAADS